MPHIIVIGAGPAGSLAALLLARQGIRVSLIEQHQFPRDKVCGECLSAVGIDVLRRAAIADALAAHHPAILTRTIWHAGTSSSAAMRLPRPMWGISRAVLDQTLLNAARDAGVAILQPARCESLDSNPQPFVRVRMLESNQMLEMQADWIVVADGKAALLPHPPKATGDLGLKAHFTGIDALADTIELFGVDGHYGGIAPIEAGLWNLAFSVPAGRVKAFGKDHDGLLRALHRENAALARRMRNATRVGDWLASPLPRFAVINNWPRGIIPIGNAVAALEPIGGEGMGLAMRSAELASQSIATALLSGDRVDLGRLRREYRKLWRIRRLAFRAGAYIISTPVLAQRGIRFVARSAGSTEQAMRLFGK